MLVTKNKMCSIFSEIQQAAELDYAYINGTCCRTCMNEELIDEHGIDSKGIWLNWFADGMNRSPWNSQTKFHIVHDVTKEQMSKIIEVLRKYFDVIYDGDTSKCIEIKSKTTTELAENRKAAYNKCRKCDGDLLTRKRDGLRWCPSCNWTEAEEMP